MKNVCTLVMLTLLTSCAAAPERLVADPAIIPAPPPYPADINRPVGDPMLPQVGCLQKTGRLCLGAGSSRAPASLTLTVLKFWLAGSYTNAALPIV